MMGAIIDLFKHDICLNSSVFTLEMESTINLVFAEDNIHSLYNVEMLQWIYYVAVWHITACFKAGNNKRVT